MFREVFVMKFLHFSKLNLKYIVYLNRTLTANLDFSLVSIDIAKILKAFTKICKKSLLWNFSQYALDRLIIYKAEPFFRQMCND